MLTEATRRALAACLYDAGFTGVARLVAEGTTDVFELDAAPEGAARERIDTIVEAVRAARTSGRAQLVLVTPDGEGGWLRPELVAVVAETLKFRSDGRVEQSVVVSSDGREAHVHPPVTAEEDEAFAERERAATPDVLDMMRRTLERGR